MTLMQDDWNRLIQLIERAAEGLDNNQLTSLEISTKTVAVAGHLNDTLITIIATVQSPKV